MLPSLSLSTLCILNLIPGFHRRVVRSLKYLTFGHVEQALDL
jgi:hypothetical protein